MALVFLTWSISEGKGERFYLILLLLLPVRLSCSSKESLAREPEISLKTTLGHHGKTDMKTEWGGSWEEEGRKQETIESSGWVSLKSFLQMQEMPQWSKLCVINIYQQIADKMNTCISVVHKELYICIALTQQLWLCLLWWRCLTSLWRSCWLSHAGWVCIYVIFLYHSLPLLHLSCFPSIVVQILC